MVPAPMLLAKLAPIIAINCVLLAHFKNYPQMLLPPTFLHINSHSIAIHQTVWSYKPYPEHAPEAEHERRNGPRGGDSKDYGFDLTFGFTMSAIFLSANENKARDIHLFLKMAAPPNEYLGTHVVLWLAQMSFDHLYRPGSPPSKGRAVKWQFRGC